MNKTPNDTIKMDNNGICECCHSAYELLCKYMECTFLSNEHNDKLFNETKEWINRYEKEFE